MSIIGGAEINNSDTTNDASYVGDSSLIKKSKLGGLDSIGPIQLPNINASSDKSPFKGFLDISIVS